MLQLKYLQSNTAVYTTDEFALISPLSADATTEDIASKVNQILDVFNKAPLTDNSSYICQLNCIFNSDNIDFELPESEEDIEVLLDGAYIEVQPTNTAESYKFNLSSLSSDKPTICYITTPFITDAIVRVHLGELNGQFKYAVPPSKIKLIPNSSPILYLQTLKQTASITFYERIQIKGSGASVPSTSYRRKRTIDENGVAHIYFGGFKSDGTTWDDKSMMSMSLWTGIPGTDSEPAQFTKEFIYDGGGGEATDLTNVFKNEFGLKRVSVVVKGNDSSIENYFMQINQVWTKTEEEDVDFYTYNDDGTIKAVDTKKCIVTSITATPNQAGYHLHAAFIKAIRGDDNSLDITHENPHAYMACYRPTSKTLKNSSNANVTVYCSIPSNTIPTSSNRAANVDFCKRNNQFDVDVIDSDGTVLYSLISNEDPRRFTASTSFDTDLQTLLSYIVFGVDPQSYLKGITSTARERTASGETKFMLDAGILFGAVNDRNSTNPIIVFGVEDSTWSSTGIFEHNVTYVATRRDIPNTSASANVTGVYDENNNLLSASVTGTGIASEWLVAVDRNDISPATDDYDVLVENGYQSMGFTVSATTNRRQGYNPAFGLRDMYMPITNQDDPVYSKNITIGAVDTIWIGGAPALATWTMLNQDALNHNVSSDVGEFVDYIPARSYSLVASGYHRGSGSSLGPFCRSANHALGYSNPDNFVACLSFNL